MNGSVIMSKEKILLVMAAGMGSRFGGLKQIEPMGPSGEFIIDYSIYDAKKAGFTKVIFIIKEENYEIFKETIGSRIESKIETEYVFQKMENIPEGYEVPKERTKPLGTAHAILCAKDKINCPFCVINADDFYGREAYFDAMNFFEQNQDENTYGLIGYHVDNTLSKNGSAKRGICTIENDSLKNLVESKVEKVNDQIIATPLHEEKSFLVQNDTIVSMNMLLFYPTLFPYLEEKLEKFLSLPKEQLQKEEFLIPDVLKNAIDEKVREVKVLPTTATWYGVTYREDKEEVVEAIHQKIKEGIYPSELWSE